MKERPVSLDLGKVSCSSSPEAASTASLSVASSSPSGSVCLNNNAVGSCYQTANDNVNVITSNDNATLVTGDLGGTSVASTLFSVFSSAAQLPSSTSLDVAESRLIFSVLIIQNYFNSTHQSFTIKLSLVKANC